MLYMMKQAETTQTAKAIRPQDLTFSQAALDRAFGKKLTHAEYLQSLRKNFNKKYENEETN